MLRRTRASATLSARGSGINNQWYDDLGDAWWDRRGPVAALHEFNPVRVGYFLEALQRELPDSLPSVGRPRVLDLGCGGGIVAETLIEGGCEVVGLDPSLPSLRVARRHGGMNAPDYLGGAAERLPLAGEAFEAVVCADVLEHVEDLDATLREIRRVLRAGGLLLFDTPTRSWQTRVALIWAAELLGFAPRRTHVYGRLLTPEDLAARCAAAGLELREVHGAELVRSPPAAVWGYLRRRELGGFRLGEDTRFVFLGVARRSD